MIVRHTSIGAFPGCANPKTNMDTKQELDNLRASYEAMGARLKELEQKHAQEAQEQQKPWEPKGGDFFIDHNGSVSKSGSRNGGRIAGSEYPTREAAESALPYITFFKRLCCLAQELNPSGKVGGRWRVWRCHSFGWEPDKHYSHDEAGALFETKEAAQRAADIMNKDRWEVPSCK